MTSLPSWTPLALVPLLFAACQAPYQGGFPPRPVWPEGSQVLVLDSGSAEVSVTAEDPERLVVTGPDGAVVAADADGQWAFELSEPGEVAATLAEGSEPQHVTFGFSPTSDEARLRVERRLGGEVVPFSSDIFARPWLRPGQSFEITVEGEGAETRVITGSIEGAEVEFLEDIPAARVIARDGNQLLRGPVRLRIVHRGEETKQVSLGVWSSDRWSIRGDNADPVDS